MRARSSIGCRRSALFASAVLAGCNPGSAAGTLIGRYDVRGVLVDNTCGQSALPTMNPLQFAVEIREDDGIGYWVSGQSNRNSGRVDDDGDFSFTVSQSSVISQTTAGDNPQPSDFIAPQADFDLQKRSCVITTQQTVTGSLQRRTAADGGVIAMSHADAGSDDDLVGENIIAVSPVAGSDCTMALTALGGAWLALPCEARYQLAGTLNGAPANANDAGAKP